MSGAFHLLAARLAGNAAFIGFLKSLVSHTALILPRHGWHEATDCSVDERIAVREALRTLDPKRWRHGLREVLAQCC